METLLIHQPFRFDVLEACLPTIIPRNLLVIGGCLERAGFPVHIHDMQIPRLPPESIQAAIAAASPGLVGIAIHAAPYVPATKACCEAVKAADPDVPIVVGGIFTSSYKEKIFDVIPEIDAVVLNEGEETIVDLAGAIRSGRSLETVPGIIYKRADGELVTTCERPMIADLRDLPVPAYDLLDLQRYRRPGILPPYIEAQRGCPYSCKFCGVHYPNRGNSVRYRDPVAVVDEAEMLHDRYGFRQFFFSDDTFNMNRRFVTAICEEMIARDLPSKVRWTAYTRADRTEPDLARLMAAAGCYSTAMGVETGSKRDTKDINKGESVNDYARGIQICKEVGIDVHALIIFGFPDVTHADIPMAARFILDARPTICQFFMFHPVPGTAFFDESEENGLYYRFERLEDWYNTDFIEPPLCDTKHLTKADVIRYFVLYNLAFHCYESPGEDPELQQRLLRDAVPHRKEEVVTVRTGRQAMYSSPVLPDGMTYADMFKNLRPLSELQYEVLLRCNGDFTIEEIATRVGKLFDFDDDDALLYVVHALAKFEQLELIHELAALNEFSHLLQRHERTEVTAAAGRPSANADGNGSGRDGSRAPAALPVLQPSEEAVYAVLPPPNRAAPALG